MSEPNLVGGSQDDREQILKLHEDYIDANAGFDCQKLETIWSKTPEAMFFNLNGHTYKGRDHWIRRTPLRRRRPSSCNRSRRDTRVITACSQPHAEDCVCVIVLRSKPGQRSR
jgi:hypothetical protein